MDIKPYGKNAKAHPSKQVEQIAASIKEFGMNQPIVVDKEGVIIVGHGRFAALRYLGWEIKPEWVMTLDLTPEQAKAYRLADNKLNESAWDMDIVIEELKELSISMVELTGFNTDLLIETEEADDVIPDVPEIPQSVLGDLYELGGHRVLCGDCTITSDVEKLMDGKVADLVFTDPPYNIDYEGKTKKRLKIENDKKTDDEFLEFLTTAFTNYHTHTAPGTAIYIFHADSERVNFQLAMQVAGYKQKQTIIWVKDSIVLGRQDYHWRHEPILYGWKDDAGRHKWESDRKQSTVWEVKRPTVSKQHPTMKPIDLCTKGIINSSKEGEIVLDFFLGSGSTLIAAEKTGRLCFGTELDPKYADVVVDRWCEYTGITDIIKNGKPYKWETKPGIVIPSLSSE